MTVEDLNAPTGEPLGMPAETISQEMPNRVPEEPAPPPADEPEEQEQGAEPSAEAEGDEPAPEQQDEKPAKPQQKLDWREKRRIEETNKRREAEAENARLKAELEALRKGGTRPAEAGANAQDPTPEQIRAAAVEEARQQIAAEARQKEFAEATGRVLQNGLAAHPDFNEARMELVANFGEQLQQRTDFFEAIVDLENGHDVFYALAKDPEQAEQVLSMPPVKMAVKLAQLSTSLGAKPAAAAKPISKAPAPVKPVAGVPQSSSRLDDEGMPMDQWAQTYLKQMAKKR